MGIIDDIKEAVKPAVAEDKKPAKKAKEEANTSGVRTSGVKTSGIK